MFRDRADAGRRLAGKLLPLKGEEPVVLALPRGGVAVGLEVALALDAPLDLLLVRKIGAPGHPEFALGAVVDGVSPEIVLDEEVVAALGVPETYLRDTARRELEEIERRRGLYLRGRTAVVVDDGIATGSTVRVALLALGRSGPARRVLAVPVAPPDTAGRLRALGDEAVFLATPADFRAVGAYYGDFRQLEDGEVVAMLERAAREPGRSGPDETGRRGRSPLRSEGRT
jgi:putative phosphoribosyl transferase